MSAKKEKRQDRGFLELAVTMAVLMSLASLLAVAFKLNDNNKNSSAAFASSVGPSESVRLVVKSDEQKAKKGPEGAWHDAFLPADFSVQAGATVKVTIENYDDMPHSFTAPGLGVNEKVPGGSDGKPGKVSFTFHAPMKAGSYEWICLLPCDPWAMEHFGFMKGHVTVT